MATVLLIIDPQNDFINRDGTATLGVAGAVGDMDRTAQMIKKYGKELDEIQITLDSHYRVHIAHARWWVNKAGDHPGPFTLISEDDVTKGIWRAYNKASQDWSLQYVQTLAKNGRYPLVIWPEHCIIGTHGQCIDPVLYAAVAEWEDIYFGIAPRTTKGSCPYTEHFSAVKADVEYPGDRGTLLNAQLVRTLQKFDDVLISGEALSHCVANTVTDIGTEFGDDQIKRLILLEDACSNVTGFEKQGEDFINAMIAKGMRLSKTTTFFK